MRRSNSSLFKESARVCIHYLIQRTKACPPEMGSGCGSIEGGGQQDPEHSNRTPEYAEPPGKMIHTSGGEETRKILSKGALRTRRERRGRGSLF